MGYRGWVFVVFGGLSLGACQKEQTPPEKFGSSRNFSAGVCGSAVAAPRYVLGGFDRDKKLIDDLNCDGREDTVSLGVLTTSSGKGLRVELGYKQLEMPLENANDAMIVGSARLAKSLPRGLMLVEADESVVLQTLVVLLRNDSLVIAPFSPKLDLYSFDPVTFPSCQLDSLAPRFVVERDSLVWVDAPYTPGNMMSANLDCTNQHRMLWKLVGDTLRPAEGVDTLSGKNRKSLH